MAVPSDGAALRRVTLRAPVRDPLLARQRLERALAAMDWAPPGLPGLLERGEHPVDGRETALHPLGGHRAAGDDAVPVEQGVAERVRPQRGVGLDGRGQRPPPRHRGRPDA